VCLIFTGIQHRRSAKQGEQPSLVREQALTINSVFDVIAHRGFLRTLTSPALAAGFRRHISAASQTYALDIRQQCQPRFHAD